MWREFLEVFSVLLTSPLSFDSAYKTLSYFVLIIICLSLVACVILVYLPEIEPGSWQWKHWVLTTKLPENSPVVFQYWVYHLCIKKMNQSWNSLQINFFFLLNGNHRPCSLYFFVSNRNYHVFYYLLAGASEEERLAFHLKQPE